MTIDSLFGSIAKLMSATSALVLSHKRIVIVAVVVLVGIWVLFFRTTNAPESYITVQPKSFSQQVAVSGKVKASQDVSASFESTGRVEQVLVAVGDKVEEGQALVALSSGTIKAQLLSAEAEVISRKSERANAVVNLEEVVKQEDTEVRSALLALLSTDLVARPLSDTYEVEPPIITGLYKSEAQGVYKIQLKRTGSASSYEVSTFDLEATKPIKVSETGPTALGTRGLFISFPEELSQYSDTTWYVEVPNRKGARYTSLYSAYEEALRGRDLAIESAQAELARRIEGGAIADASLAVAEAEVARLSAELAKQTLRAPFAGTVTLVDVAVGDTVSANVPVVAVMSIDELEIESFVPEINISYLEVGDSATVTLDAYGENVPFQAFVRAIDPAETVRDGVSTYRVRLAFATPDARIRPGMTANIVITTDEREGVLSVPLGAILRKNGQAFVQVQQGKAVDERLVVTGSVSSLGEIEIISGLSSGEVVRVGP